MAPVLRFAPSPTGRLHIGNARPALLNWLHALATGGTFILRFDDTDRERSTEEFARAIADDLRWLGVEPHRTVRQSDRFPLYDAAADRLRSLGRLYPCYESEDELERRRKRQAARGLPPIYDRAALKLTPEEKAGFEAEGRKPHWRFLLDHETVEWDDLVRGPSHIDCASLSDPVLIRADGTYLYTLPSVVDDVDLGVTDVIRGEDHVTNTAVQIQLFRLLGGSVPRFGHHNLLTTAGGEGLSKRLGHLSLASLRERGLEPMAVAALAVLVGSSEAVRPVGTLVELSDIVKLDRLSRAPAKFDEAELDALNARLLHETPFPVVADRLAALGIAGGEDFWLAVRGNVERLAQTADWWKVVTGPVQPVVEDPSFAATAADLLPPEPWDAGTWAVWTEAVKDATGARGRALFMPLRLVLTGLAHGPELKALLPLIGRERALARLVGRTA
jgi:glutamyl-tRNA synthetase